ncbi:MAG: hypothetical protein PUD93_11410 [Lachnospiraceae bacterium]|nr:hypothetical protein [Lachnospiraceae bacterium]
MIPNTDDYWWWLITPWSTKCNGYDTLVAVVSPSGYFGYDDCGLSSGVRPFCIFSSVVSDFVTNLIPALGNILVALVPIISTVVKALSPILGMVGELIVALLPTMTQIINALAPIIQMLASVISATLGNAFQFIMRS